MPDQAKWRFNIYGDTTMKNIYIWSVLIIGLPIIFYLLWINGYMVLNTKRAVLFVGSARGDHRCKINFISCSGSVKKVIKFNESRSYIFHFKNIITRGTVSVELLNKNKEVKLKLNPSIPTGVLIVDRKERYYLVLRFDKADGEYELTWHECHSL